MSRNTTLKYPQKRLVINFSALISGAIQTCAPLSMYLFIQSSAIDRIDIRYTCIKVHVKTIDILLLTLRLRQSYYIDVNYDNRMTMMLWQPYNMYSQYLDPTIE